MLKRMLPSNNMAIRHLSQEEGISEATPHNWRAEARGKGQLLPDLAQSLAGLIAELNCQQSSLVPDTFYSPNQKLQKRRHKTMTGVLVATGSLGPVLAIGERCHIGRAAIEGLGRYRLVIRSCCTSQGRGTGFLRKPKTTTNF